MGHGTHLWVMPARIAAASLGPVFESTLRRARAELSPLLARPPSLLCVPARGFDPNELDDASALDGEAVAGGASWARREAGGPADGARRADWLERILDTLAGLGHGRRVEEERARMLLVQAVRRGRLRADRIR